MRDTGNTEAAWIRHGGEGCPIAGDTKVYVQLRDGTALQCRPARHLRWGFYPSPNDKKDIVAYCLHEPSDLKGVETPAATSALSSQVSGDHYKKLKIQPIEYIHGNNIPFAEGCVIKYVSRWRDKGGVKDLEKAKHFLEMLIELESRSVVHAAGN